MWERILSCISVIALAGCSLNKDQAAPVIDISNYQTIAQGFHVVHEGESLYEIAWRYDKDYRDIAQMNDIPAPYTIYPGQKIFLNKQKQVPIKNPTWHRNSVPSQTQSASLDRDNSNVNHKEPTLLVEFPKKPINPKQIEKNKPIVNQGNLSKEFWQWPAHGKIIKHFSDQGVGPKGIDIAGKAGDKIFAAGAGKVVYSGSGLRGYGQLVIIKHNDTYLSAYGHNNRLLVKEGEMIVKGQQIAEMGSDGSQVKLHFEIRKNGHPINPLSILPGNA